jgi:uncharacterized protein
MSKVLSPTSKDLTVSPKPCRFEIIAGKAIYEGDTLKIWASRAAHRITERFNPTNIFLYGSVARGDDGPDSDVDLLVIIPIEGRRHDKAVQILRECRDLPIPIDITVIDPNCLEKKRHTPGIIRAALREGYILAAA